MTHARLLAPLALTALLSAPALAQAPGESPQPAPEQPADAPSPEDEDPEAVSARDAQQEEESPEEQLDRLLKTRQVTLNFDETPLADALGFVQDVSGLNIVTYPGVPADVAVTLRLRDISLLNAIKLILASHEDLDHAIWAGAVVVKPRATKLPPLEPKPQAPEGSLERTIWTQVLTLNFNDTPAPDVVDFLRDITGLNIVVTAAAKPKLDAALVTLKVRGMDLGRVLTHLTDPHGLRWTAGEAVTIDVKLP